MLNRPLSHDASRLMLLVFVYFLVASASFNGFFLKWHFRDGMPEASLPQMLEGTAHRPYVYRQLLPSVANGIERLLPHSVKQRADALLLDDRPAHHPIARYYASTPDSRDARYALRYYMIYAMSFGALLTAMLALRGVCLDLRADPVSATLAPLAFALILPLLMAEGGYYYDMTELLFMALAVRYALKARILALAVLTALATYNKESFLFFVFTLYPFLRVALPVRKTLGVQGALLGIAVAVNLLVKAQFAHNAGGVVEDNFFVNLQYLANALNYLQFEYNYGVLTTKGFNVVHVFLMAVLVRLAWPRLPLILRQSLLIATAINVPLFLAFGCFDELRGLSFLYVGFVMILCAAIRVCIEGTNPVHQETEKNNAVPAPTVN